MGDNIKTDLKEIGCQSVDWIEVSWNGVQWWGLVNTLMVLSCSTRTLITERLLFTEGRNWRRLKNKYGPFTIFEI